MQRAPIPDCESERIQTLRDMLILDTAPEERFDAVTTFCASMFGVPIALISLIDSERQWFKSNFGLDACETPRDISFCGHAIHRDSLLVIENALLDPRFCDNPLVTGPPHIRFYAGAPLRMQNGMRIGTLCLIHHKPHRLDKEEEQLLADLARMVVRELENGRAQAEAK